MVGYAAAPEGAMREIVRDHNQRMNFIYAMWNMQYWCDIYTENQPADNNRTTLTCRCLWCGVAAA
jgi:hypothetical protein